ncbi:MAG: CcmD family protein [Actinobacteria bacterium]|nr:CcmD family protein [Actinomycetota bacterium]
MEASNLELYTLVLHDAPFVIAAYAILWASLMVYISMVLRRLLKIEKEMSVLQEFIDRRNS